MTRSHTRLKPLSNSTPTGRKSGGRTCQLAPVTGRKQGTRLRHQPFARPMPHVASADEEPILGGEIGRRAMLRLASILRHKVEGFIKIASFIIILSKFPPSYYAIYALRLTTHPCERSKFLAGATTIFGERSGSYPILPALYIPTSHGYHV